MSEFIARRVKETCKNEVKVKAGVTYSQIPIRSKLKNSRP